MKVAELGEFGLIDVLKELIDAEPRRGPAWERLIIGIGDDAAAWRGDARTQLATIEALVQDVHFRLSLTSWEDLGWKSLAVNLSDIAAMGGRADYALVSLALPGETDVRDIVMFYQGALTLAREFDVAVVGGNIARAPLVVINIAILGSGDGLLRRSAARAGDQVAVTGYLGASAAGLETLNRGTKLPAKAMRELQRAFRKPYPRLKEGQALAAHGVQAAIDVSDGLIADLGHICEESSLGALVETAEVPVSPAAKSAFGERALSMALSGGEDYELIFTAEAAVMESIKAHLGCPVTVIGEMVADRTKKVRLVDARGKPSRLRRRGWDHFAGKTDAP